MRIKSFVGGHDIHVYAGCQFNSDIRKYTGGTIIATIPFSGKILNAEAKQEESELIEYGNTVLPVMSKTIFTRVDPIPDTEECDLCIVSNKYVSACRSLGIETSRLLTIGDSVVDEEGRIIGCINLNRN